MATITNPTGKRLQINKANAMMVIVVGIAAFMVSFSIVASRALWQKYSYQSRVITEKGKAEKQLEANVKAVNSLITSYQAFVQTPDNVIGGNSSGSGDRDGDNAKITLDALPSKYDYPALAASLEKVLTSNNFTIKSITGNDDQIAQSQANNNQPQPTAMPFQIEVTSNFDSLKSLMSIFERSIRPINVQSLDMQGNNGSIDITISASSYYQPAKTLNVQTKVVK